MLIVWDLQQRLKSSFGFSLYVFLKAGEVVKGYITIFRSKMSAIENVQRFVIFIYFLLLYMGKFQF